ncbi:MAG: ABC transporter permease subunit [Microcella sp.]
MTALPLFSRALADSWRGLIGWAVGLAAVAGLYLPLFPSFGGGSQFADIIESLPPELVSALNYDQITSGAGYTQGTVYGLLGFVLLTIAATGWGAAAIAGDEERGTLELTLAHGVSRTQLVLERAAAIVVKLIALVGWITLVVLVLNGPSELDLAASNVVAGGIALFGLALLTALIGMLAGALIGRRVIAVGAAAGLAVAAYAANAIGNQSPDLAWLHAVSPYHWAFGESPLADGLAAPVGLLYLFAALALAGAVIAFRRRDVGV